MVINYSDFRLVVINYATSLESLGLSTAVQFLQSILKIASRALTDQKVEVRESWTVVITIPQLLLKSEMEDRHQFSLAGFVLDLFEKDGKLEILFEGETLKLLGIPLTE